MKKKVENIWNKIGKTGQRLTLIVTIIGSISVIGPIISDSYKTTVKYVKFIKHAPDKIDSLEIVIKNLQRYQIETAGILMSNMERFDENKLAEILSGNKLIFINERKYKVKINDEYIQAEFGITKRGDVIVHVPDGKVTLYQSNYSHSKRRFSYNTFEEDGYMIIEFWDE